MNFKNYDLVLITDEKERLFAHIAAHKARAENTEKEKGENL